MAAEQPKKPAGGAFGRFLNENRAKFVKECEGQSITAVSKLASERFKALSDSERAEWQKKFEQAKEQYEKDMKAFLEAGGELKAIKRKGKGDDKAAKKRKKDPEAPKRPAGGAFGCFLAKNRADFMKECEGKPITAVTKMASEKWQTLSEEDKKPYAEEYIQKKAAYEEAMKSYVPPPKADGEEDAEEKATKKPRKSSEDKEAAKKAKQDEKDSAKKAKQDAKSKKVAMKAAKAEKPPGGRGRGRGRVLGVRGRGTAAVSSGPAVELQATVAAKAEKAGFTAQLMKLAAREDVIASGKSQTAMLKALEESGGLLHPARRALLGA